jgi:hypothetical protein
VPWLSFPEGEGIVTAAVGVAQLWALLRRPRSQLAWLVEHVAGIVGAGGIAHAALAVNVARRFTDDPALVFAPGAPVLLLFAAAIWRISRRIRGTRGGSPTSPAPAPSRA